MQFPESWLRTFCNPTIGTAELAETLTMAGLEVEELQPVSPPFSNIVVGEIKAAEQHPNADRLRVCKVDVGQAELLNIVCGAPNARVGIRVPCALVGAELPPGEDGKPFLIKVGKLRGVESQGMLCSARELKLSEDHGGLLELAADAPIGQNIREHLNLDDTLFTLKLTPNLAHCLSVYGVAHEVSALTGAPLLVPAFPAVTVGNGDRLPVTVSATDLCGRFSGRVVRNVNPKAKTPQWMVDRLARCGQRSVTALVDISNYVMFELGRPSHIFDLAKIKGGLDVRWGVAGEQLKLLNGNTVSVDGQVGVIADEAQVDSLAGIMGGDATAVSDDTRDVYVEAAFWWPKAIAGRSRRFNFSTDAGHRFERGVDPMLTVEHIERITQLIIDVCGTPETSCGPVDDQQPAMPVSRPISLRVARASKIIGMPLSQQQCVDALTRLGLAQTETAGVITVTPPSYRFDLQIEEDLIEEVARMVGYHNLPGWEHELAGNPNPIKLLNPIASQMSVMRSSLVGSLLQVLKFNQARKASRVRVFEVGRVFLRDASVKSTDSTVEGFDQPMRVAGLASGSVDPLQWGTADVAVDFFSVKGDVESLLAPFVAEFKTSSHPAMHPGRCASVWIEGKSIGDIGELHPKWRQSYDLSTAPILFELELDPIIARRVPVFASMAKIQAVQRDVAVIVKDSVTYAELMRAIWSAPTAGLLRDAQLFDVYRPKFPEDAVIADDAADRSLAVRLTLNSDEASLTEEQLETAVKAIVEQLATAVGARQRA